ncbi:MAG: hypothetical protein MJZ66_00255 [Bacteroidales bacterium]|nr:hypothetical protein [Bacteroidales bacterium]
MGLPRFFPESKIHRFEYRPLFYNEDKEDFERRRAEIRKELGKEDAQDVRILQHGTFKRMYERRHEELKGSNRRIMILAICIGLVVYFTNRYFGFI